MSKAKKRLSKFNFEDDGAAVALVGSFQGGPANGVTTLITKSTKDVTDEEIRKALSKDVTVKMNIIEFLTRYLDVYWGDAEVIAGLLGYSAEDIAEGEEYIAGDWADHIENKLSNIQINKSAESKETLDKFVETFKSFKAKYLEKNLTSSVESEGGDVVNKTEDEPTNKEVVTKMTEEVTQDSLEEMIKKAASDLAKEQIANIEKAYEEKAAETAKELQVLKAAHETRTHQEYLKKAEEYAQFLGEDADKEAIAKALRSIEGFEEAAPVMQILKSLKDLASKDDLLTEVGKSATKEQPSDLDSQAIAIAKSLRESDPSLSERQAEMKAYEQLYAQQ